MARRILAIAATALAVIAAGCLPPEADFKWGLGTNAVVGTVKTAGEVPDFSDILVIVFRKHYLLKTMETEERIYTITAHLGGVDREGRFSIPMPADVVSLDMIFVAPDHLSDEFRFNRQVGIGEVTYRADLKFHPDWRTHFYTYIQPILSELITDDRYRLSESDQLRLSDWLQSQQARVTAARSAATAGSPGKMAPAVPPADP